MPPIWPPLFAFSSEVNSPRFDGSRGNVRSPSNAPRPVHDHSFRGKMDVHRHAPQRPTRPIPVMGDPRLSGQIKMSLKGGKDGPAEEVEPHISQQSSQN